MKVLDLMTAVNHALLDCIHANLVSPYKVYHSMCQIIVAEFQIDWALELQLLFVCDGVILQVYRIF